MKKFILTSFLFIISFNALAEVLSRKHIFIYPSYSFPVYGHWGDENLGFKKSFGVKAMYIKDIDELISVGVIASNFKYYENNSTDMKIGIFSFTPVLFSWLGYTKKRYYTYLGFGIYHWTQPSSSLYTSSSQTEFGFKGGCGAILPFYKKIDFGVNIEFNHILNMSGPNFDLGSVNNLDFSLGFKYSF